MTPGSSADTLSIEAKPEALRSASFWLDELARLHGVPAEPRGRLDLCLNEAIANVLFHGGEAALAEPIILNLICNDVSESCREATICISDAGVQFDASHAEQKQLPESLLEAEPGGLGIILLRKLTDSLRYSYQDHRNHLQLTVRWQDAP